jgi:hypothetical protein
MKCALVLAELYAMLTYVGIWRKFSRRQDGRGAPISIFATVSRHFQSAVFRVSRYWTQFSSWGHLYTSMSSTVAPAPTPTDTHSDSSSPPSTAGANHVHNFILFAAAAMLIGACIIVLERTWHSMMVISALMLPEPRLQRDGRRRRRKLVPPVLYETWLSPLTVTSTGKGAVGTSWRSIQVCIDPGFGHSCSSLRLVHDSFLTACVCLSGPHAPVSNST